MRDYVVQTHPCSEVIAKVSLEARGFEIFLPTVCEEIRTGRMRERRTSTIAPLFPGYLFVRMDLNMFELSQVKSAKGVKCILGVDSSRPTPLPLGAVADLQARYQAGEFAKRVSTYRVSAGDRLTVTSGAFQGFSGVCRESRSDRIKALLSTLWGAIAVDLPSNFVTKVLDDNPLMGV